MTPEKLQEILNKHKLWLDGDPSGERANLSEANLSRADLSRADLSEANLSEADLRYANLSEANLRYADLRYANLSEANLSRADLSRADLSEANLSEADLRYANLSEANLRYANLSEANLRYANLSEANLSKAEGLLSAVNFLEAHFERTEDGYIAYKTFGECYAKPEDWKLEPGSVLSENVNFDRCVECGCGVNVAPLDWVRREYPYGTIWKVLIRWEWLAGVCVPYHSDGKIRCERVELIDIVN